MSLCYWVNVEKGIELIVLCTLVAGYLTRCNLTEYSHTNLLVLLLCINRNLVNAQCDSTTRNSNLNLVAHLFIQ